MRAAPPRVRAREPRARLHVAAVSVTLEVRDGSGTEVPTPTTGVTLATEERKPRWDGVRGAPTAPV